MTAALWSHIGFARAAALLGSGAGLSFAPNRQPAAEQGMRRVMLAHGIRDPLAFADALGRDPALLGELLAEVTVGETYFFREPGQLDYIRRCVLPDFRPNRTADHPLRVWSAGCATGEECYTLAILLREEGWTGRATLLGTDISRARIQAARQARYTRWSMRGMDAREVDRYFTVRGSHYLLRPELRAMAEFRLLNLADEGWMDAVDRMNEMDLVLCRNVLIYFSRDAIAEVARRLLDSLSEDGWLFLGASDPLISEILDCETVVTAAGIAYRRPSGRSTRLTRVVAGAPFVATVSDSDRVAPSDSGSSADAPAHPQPPPLDAGAPFQIEPGIRLELGEPSQVGVSSPSSGNPEHATMTAGPATPTPVPEAQRRLLAATARYAERDYPAAVEIARAITHDHPELAAGWAVLVRALANRGRTDEAERQCTRGIELHPASAELAYLHAVLLIQHGQFAAAAAAARRTLYLDRSLAVAHLALGTALGRLGHTTQAARSFVAAERALEALAPDAIVPLADGETVDRLRQAAATQHRLLGDAVA